MQVLQKTPLNRLHHDLKARMSDFAGWELPVWYTSILEEHRAVRRGAGIFDVSHMGRVWVSGREAGAFLDKMLTRPVPPLEAGYGQLCLMCLENGGILDDLWVYRAETNRYLIVWNAGNRARKLDWLLRFAALERDVTVGDVSHDTVMVAVQGPAVPRLKCLEGVSGLPRFGGAQAEIGGLSVFVARTGYTGEDGFEIISDAANALPLWQLFTGQGVKPCGLGARDSLRLEAGMLLYGQDMDVRTNPFVVGLGWLVDLDDGEFIGKSALLEIRRRGVTRRLVGFQMEGREIARPGYKIFKAGEEVGRVTSGGYSPTLGAGIGFGDIPAGLAHVGTDIEIMIRGRPAAARVVSRQFYRRGVFR